MSESLVTRLDQLEILYSEQDHVIQSLNDVVARQAQELSHLKQDLQLLETQLQQVKTDFSGSIDPAQDKPPHY